MAIICKNTFKIFSYMDFDQPCYYFHHGVGGFPGSLNLTSSLDFANSLLYFLNCFNLCSFVHISRHEHCSPKSNHRKLVDCTCLLIRRLKVGCILSGQKIHFRDTIFFLDRIFTSVLFNGQGFQALINKGNPLPNPAIVI